MIKGILRATEATKARVMLFVPLPLFATFLLVLVLVRFVLRRDMRLRAHQLFAALIGLYAAQSLLTSLRWGYGIGGITVLIAILAPVLPALAYLAYRALSGRLRGAQFWPLGVVIANWAAYAAMPALADPLILITYLGFGAMLLRLYLRGADDLTLPAINDAAEIRLAMGLTGVMLIASALTDIYVIYDFITIEGRSAGMFLSVVQPVFVVAIGTSAVLGRSAATSDTDTAEPSVPVASEADSDILNRLDDLFTRERLHLSEDISLRRLARRLGVPDRQVSNAVNRARGMSVSQYVNEHRIKEACRLLRDTDDSVLTVSLASGFATKSNFNREFARVTGQTPSQWRVGE